jgi:hypothetical protein
MGSPVSLGFLDLSALLATGSLVTLNEVSAKATAAAKQFTPPEDSQITSVLLSRAQLYALAQRAMEPPTRNPLVAQREGVAILTKPTTLDTRAKKDVIVKPLRPVLEEAEPADLINARSRSVIGRIKTGNAFGGGGDR